MNELDADPDDDVSCNVIDDTVVTSLTAAASVNAGHDALNDDVMTS